MEERILITAIAEYLSQKHNIKLKCFDPSPNAPLFLIKEDSPIKHYIPIDKEYQNKMGRYVLLDGAAQPCSLLDVYAEIPAELDITGRSYQQYAIDPQDIAGGKILFHNQIPSTKKDVAALQNQNKAGVVQDFTRG